MNKLIGVCLLCLPVMLLAQGKIRATPDQLYGQLFADVQLNQVFADGKTFVDCIPKRKPRDIMYDYGMMKGEGFNLAKFVAANFTLPSTKKAWLVKREKTATLHIKNLWAALKRLPDLDTAAFPSSLIPLPKPYVVPGGRFREIYYWDSYFTMLGLKESGQVKLIENMIQNFDYLVQTVGHIPNGNRTYYLSRSQPPFFCMMVELLAGIKGKQVYQQFLPSMEKEYNWWMKGVDSLAAGEAVNSVVKLSDGTVFNRYWDENNTPRQESYRQDTETAEAAAQQLAMIIKVASPEKLKEILDNRKAAVLRDLRAGACSGWDFSSRWFKDPGQIATIQTSNIIPVDLNCLVYSMERIIATAYEHSGNKKMAALYNEKATTRSASIVKYCWNGDSGYFYDYIIDADQQSAMVTAAGVFPLFVKLATPAQAAAVAKTVTTSLLKPGGLVTTTNSTGQQWDAPNGWAPLQWAAVAGLSNYKQNILARKIATRWIKLNDRVYQQTGKMMEKYNVEDMSKLAGVGEYPSQDGFGWTNGVYLAMKKYLAMGR